MIISEILFELDEILKNELSKNFEILVADKVEEIKIFLESIKIDLCLIDELDENQKYQVAIEEIKKQQKDCLARGSLCIGVKFTPGVFPGLAQPRALFPSSGQRGVYESP